MSSYCVLVDTDEECLRLVIDNWLLITFPNTEIAEKVLLAANQLRITWKWLVNKKLTQAVSSYTSPNDFKRMFHYSSSCSHRTSICHNNYMASKINPISIRPRLMRFKNTRIFPLLLENYAWICSLDLVNLHRRYPMCRVRTEQSSKNVPPLRTNRKALILFLSENPHLFRILSLLSNSVL